MKSQGRQRGVFFIRVQVSEEAARGFRRRSPGRYRLGKVRKFLESRVASELRELERLAEEPTP